MKTAIEILKSVLDKSKENYNTEDVSTVIKGIIYLIDNGFIESEKQQIIKAYDDAFKYVVGGGFVAKTGKQYFEETYNDKK